MWVSSMRSYWTDYLNSHANPAAVEYYLCGPPMMIKACTRMLAELGVPEQPDLLR